MAGSVRLLDLDGTLVLTFPTYARALARVGPISEDAALASLTSGTPVVKLADRIRGGRSAFITALRSIPVQVVPGWLETIETLRRDGVSVGVVTSLPGKVAVPVLERSGIAPLLDVVIHAGICRVPKPHPRSLLTAFAYLRRKPSSDDFYVGDMPNDAAAAKAAGIDFAWASWGYGPDDGYPVVLDHPEALLDL
jgi:phosphoglycolate phosphatase-like HAD superfamily hydrolase